MITAKLRVLIADDDAVSREFLHAAVTQLGASAVVTENVATALAAAHAYTIDLLLLDRCMPDGNGVDLLQQLRGAGIVAPAIVTSAQLDDLQIAHLRAAGFCDVLPKPATFAEIASLLQRHGSIAPMAAARSETHADATSPAALMAPLLDDAGALRAIGGDRQALTALRALFAGELDALENDLRGASALGDERFLLGQRLHRLQASCGFCGAPALGAAAARLEQLLHGRVDTTRHCDELLELSRATRRALALAI